VFELKVLADNGFDIFKRTLGTIGSDDTLKYETVLKVDPISNINKHTYLTFLFILIATPTYRYWGITMILRKECTQAIEYDETQFRCRVSFIYPRQGVRGHIFSSMAPWSQWASTCA
jgi:hypothetical protein